jgi:hypothetical protein
VSYKLVSDESEAETQDEVKVNVVIRATLIDTDGTRHDLGVLAQTEEEE